MKTLKHTKRKMYSDVDPGRNGLRSCHEKVGAYAINTDETALPLAGKGQGMHMDYRPKR